jgi:hypothetical protein
VTGLRMRLRRLGYRCAPAGSPDDVDDRLLACIEAFQRAEEIDDPVEPYGPATLDKLKDLLDEKFDA